MICIVPLAGPDFHDPAYGAKPFVRVGDTTLIEATVGQRAWLKHGIVQPSEIVFVLRDTPVTAAAEVGLLSLFPGARTVRLSHGTGGALLSALAAVTFAQCEGGPVIVDLADLAFDIDNRAICATLERFEPAGIIPWFISNDPAYSYLRFQGDQVVETAEKRLISSQASAGVYFFRSASLLLTATAGCLADTTTKVNGALFTCPAYNVLIGAGEIVRGIEVSNVRSYSKDFHRVALAQDKAEAEAANV